MARPEPPLREPDDFEGVAADMAQFGVAYVRTAPKEYPPLRLVTLEHVCADASIQPGASEDCVHGCDQ